MSEKNKLLKEKMSKAHKIVKSEAPEDPAAQEAPTQSNFVWDLTVTNE